MKSFAPAENPDAYVKALSGWRKALVRRLRAAASGAAGLEERIKWGHLVYFSNGPVLLIRAEEKRVLFGFWRGKRLFPWIAQGRNREHSLHADIRHELMLGTDLFSGDRGSDELCCFEPPPIDAYEPGYGFVPTGELSPYTWDLDSEIKEIAIQDRLRFADRWAVLLGLRYTDFQSDFADFVDGAAEPSSTAEFSGSETSSQLGVVYTLSERVALFANRSEAFVPRNELDINTASGNPKGVMAHTWSGGSGFTSVKVNGIRISEVGVGAAIAGQFGVPTIMVSGDDALVEECRELLGDVEALDISMGRADKAEMLSVRAGRRARGLAHGAVCRA